jgi:MarR family transcriptional regulator for hemolysin
VLPIIHLSRLGDGVRHGVLAEDMGIEGPSLGRLLDQLCQAGLIERRGDAADKRAKLLYLTEQGHAMAATVEKLIEELRSKLLARIADEDLEATLRVFAAFDAALHPGNEMNKLLTALRFERSALLFSFNSFAAAMLALTWASASACHGPTGR